MNFITFLKSTIVFSITISFALWIFVCIGLWIKQETLIFPAPSRSLESPPASTDYRLGQLTTLDRLKLSFWEVAPRDHMPVIIFFHGNGELASDKAFYRGEPSLGSSLKEYIQKGFGVVVAEYRGYGGNPGKASEAGVIMDAHGYYQYVHKTWKNSKVILWGESLGTGVAIGLATDTNVDGLLLDAPFTSIEELVHDKFPIIPITLLERNPFNSFARLGSIKAPVFVLHGTQDGVIPVEMGIRIANNIPCRAGKLILPVNHVVSALDHTGQAGKAIEEFMLDVASGKIKCLI